MLDYKRHRWERKLAAAVVFKLVSAQCIFVCMIRVTGATMWLSATCRLLQSVNHGFLSVGPLGHFLLLSMRDDWCNMGLVPRCSLGFLHTREKRFTMKRELKKNAHELTKLNYREVQVIC